MMVATGGNKGCLLAITLGKLESEHAAIKGKCAFDVGYL